MNLEKSSCPKVVVVLCGGLGTRLRPYTVSIPKPLMPVNGKPILEIIVQQLANQGFEKIILAVNYHAEMIRAYFQDGRKWGIAIEYCEEKEPLGTIGPLRLMLDLPDKFLLMNGDILTDLNFFDLWKNHDHASELITIPLKRRSHTIDFGVFEVDTEMKVLSFTEKPTHHFSVSMGVYCLSRPLLSLIPERGAFGFDELIKKMLSAKKAIKCFEHEGYWLDIGRFEDYEAAQTQNDLIQKILEGV